MATGRCHSRCHFPSPVKRRDHCPHGERPVVSVDDRLAKIIRANQERIVDQLTADAWSHEGRSLRRSYPNEQALRLFMEAFVDGLRRSFTAEDGDHFVDTYGVSLGRRYAEESRDYDEVYSSLIVVKNGVLPFVLRADPPIEPLVLRLTDGFFRLEHEVARRDYEAAKRHHAQFGELGVLKSGFMRLTTHELRRPLGGFRGYLSMVESGDLGDLPEAVHKAIIQIALSANEMAKLCARPSAGRRLEGAANGLRRGACAG